MNEVARTLDDMAAFTRRFVVLTDEQAATVALWVFHSHAIDAAESTPYLSISSALPRSGKSLLLEVLELTVHVPLPTANISDAALFRCIEKLQPTLLFDEIDAIFGPKARDREDLRGMLNAGYRRGAKTYRMGGANKTALEDFAVFSAKCFAGIGELPATIRDRTIRVRLERRIREERIDRFRRRDAAVDAEPLRESMRALAEHHLPALMEARPKLPAELDDRAQDVWEPLLAIADVAGEPWASEARRAAVKLSSGSEREDDSTSVVLLVDIREVFAANPGRDALRSADLIQGLVAIEESGWGDWFGKPISPQRLGGLLKPFGIKTMPIWVDGATARGYKLEQFERVWARVLEPTEPDTGVQGVRGVRGVRSGSSIEAAPNTPNAPNTLGTGGEGDRDGLEWLGRDGGWRSFESNPPVFPGEVVEVRSA